MLEDLRRAAVRVAVLPVPPRRRTVIVNGVDSVEMSFSSNHVWE